MPWILLARGLTRCRQSLMEPGLRHGPFALDRGRRYAERVGRLGDVEPGEESQLHDAALPGVERRQRLERLVEREHVHAGRDVGRRSGRVVQADHRGAAATLVGPLSTGVIDEDLAHQPGRQRKEVRPAVQRHAVHIHESQEDLVDESRRLEGVSGRFPPEMAARHPPQLVILQRNQAVERRGVSLAPGQEQPGDVVRAGGVRHQLVMGKRSVLRFSSYRTREAKHAGTGRHKATGHAIHPSER